MSLLKKDQLQKSAGLLNSSAPEDHFLAYITADEKDMLVQAGGKETPTASGIKAYPPPVSSEADSRAYHTPSERGPPGGGSGGPSGDMHYEAPPPHAEEFSDITTDSTIQDTYVDDSIPSQPSVVNTWKSEEVKPGWEYDPNEFEGVSSKLSPYETGDVDAEDEYLEPDKDHWKATQKAIKKFQKGDNYQADWNDWTKEQQDAYQLEMNNLKGTKGKRYSFYKGNEGTINLSFGEHWKDVVITDPALKFSPVMRFLVAAGRTVKENATTDYGTWKYGSKEGTGSGRPLDQGGWLGRVFNSDGSVNENLTEREANDIYNQVQPDLPFKEPPTTDSPAKKWFENKNYNNNTFNFSFQKEYNEAKARQASILGNPSPMKYLAVNESPYYDFLKKNKLDRGIL